MTGNHQFGLKCGKLSDRFPGGVPVRREVSRRTMHLERLDGDLVRRLLSRGDERVASHKHPVRFAPERYMAGSVPGCMNPAPARHSRDGLIARQRFQPRAEIDWSAREKR